MVLQNAFENLATEAKQDDLIAALALLEEVTIRVAAGEAIGLDAATLAALEAITVSGTVALDGPTLAALENVTVSGPLTDTQMRATSVNIADSGEREYTHIVATVTAAGNTTIHTPAAGKAIRLVWIYAINDPTATTPTLIKVSLGATELYRVWALSKRQLSTGVINAPLVINLSAAGAVAVTAILEEYTP